jgi:hypothetical protein
MNAGQHEQSAPVPGMLRPSLAYVLKKVKLPVARSSVIASVSSTVPREMAIDAGAGLLYCCAERQPIARGVRLGRRVLDSELGWAPEPGTQAACTMCPFGSVSRAA